MLVVNSLASLSLKAPLIVRSTRVFENNFCFFVGGGGGGGGEIRAWLYTCLGEILGLKIDICCALVLIQTSRL